MVNFSDRRAEKRVEYVWDGEVLAWELDTERGPRTFVHEPGGFEPILQQQSGETYLCVNDHLGMPKELIDGEGNLAWAGAHSAYGAVIATQGPDDVAVDGGFVQSDGPRVESPFRLLGQVNDEDAELAWTRFRCFDADTGTWISTDPLEIAGGLNLYGFDGSPSDVVDPFGLATSGGNHDKNDDDYVPGDYLAKKAPMQVAPGTKVLEGQYVDDRGKVQPWKAHYDDYGRLVGRTDYNAGNRAAGIPDTHYHTYDWTTRGAAGQETGSHIPGEYVPR